MDFKDKDQEKQIDDLYYVNPTMIKFLLEENLVLKLMLFDKGILSSENYNEYKEKAKIVLANKKKEILSSMA